LTKFFSSITGWCALVFKWARENSLK
jgi:hypothetical protein